MCALRRGGDSSAEEVVAGMEETAAVPEFSMTLCRGEP